MAKMCWKCGKYHEEGISSCPYCGASFTSEDEKYQSDGRTVSSKDETAYLSAPPPKYRRSHMILPAVIIFAMVVAFFVIAASGFPGTSDPDVRYDYKMWTADYIELKDHSHVGPDAGMTFIVMEIKIVNDKASRGVSDSVDIWQFSVKCDGKWYKMDAVTREYVNYHFPTTVWPGYDSTFYEIFQVPKGQDSFKVDLDYQGNERVKQDDSILI